MISLTDHDSSEGEQWGRDQIYPETIYICMDNGIQWDHDCKLYIINTLQLRNSSADILKNCTCFSADEVPRSPIHMSICSMYGIFINIYLQNHTNVDKYTVHRASGICPYVCSYQTTMLIPFLWRNPSHDLGRQPRSQRRAAKSFGRGLQWRLLEPGNVRDGRDSDAKIGKNVRKTVGFNNKNQPKGV